VTAPARVALLRCPDYRVERVEASLRQGFALLGGDAFLRRLIPPGSTVLLKPNLLSAEPKGSPVVTDWCVFEASVRVLSDYAGRLTFGDSPGFGGARRAAESCGLMEVAQRYGVAFDPFESFVSAPVPERSLVGRFDVATAALEADVLISLPRLKTHGMTSYTGAIKNQFGCVPGLKKANWHSRMPRVGDFSRMLLDVNRLVDTRFAILDGIVAMEGNGPRNGRPHTMETLIMGESLSAVDALAAHLIGYRPGDIPYLRAARETGFGPIDLDEIEVLGENPESMKPAHFERIRGRSSVQFRDGRAGMMMRRLLAPRPVLDASACIGCRQCGAICPEDPKVISFEGAGNESRPVWDYDRCIRCFCCQEICPAGAIDIRYPWGAKLLGMDR